MSADRKARPEEVEAFLHLLFGDVSDVEGRFTAGQMPVWSAATKRTTWCPSIEHAVTAIATASDAGQDAYFPVALHDHEVALRTAQQREDAKAKSEQRAPKPLTLDYVRGCVESATVLVGLWMDEDHAEGKHKKKDRLPPNRAAILDYLREIPCPLTPLLVVDTVGGVHIWLPFREPLHITSERERARAESIARRYQALIKDQIAPNYEHDSTADLARVMRVPGAVNTKYGRLAQLVDLMTGEPIAVPEDVDSVDVSEIEEQLDLLAVHDEVPRPRSAATAQPAPAVSRTQSSAVQALLDGSLRIRDLFLGKGKLGVGQDGRTVDTSSSGYDFSLVMALARKGVTDTSALATALWLRPDGAARAKGTRYIQATVERAVARAAAIETERASKAQAQLDFQVDGVRLFKSNPASYELTINGTALRLSTTQLLSRSGFARAFTDALNRVPGLPSEPEDWTPIVNGWLARAERVEMPPEASDESALREAIERCVADLPVADSAADLDHGKAVPIDDGRLAFKAETLLRALREEFPDLKRNQLCRVLRDVGYAADPHRFGPDVARTWVLKSNAPDTRARES